MDIGSDMKLFDPQRRLLETLEPTRVVGQVASASGSAVGVSDFPAPMGASCRILRGRRSVEAQVIGFDADRALVMPLGSIDGVRLGDSVELGLRQHALPVGPALLGRVVDALGRPMDGGPAPRCEELAPIWPRPIEPMQRRRITQPMPTGIRAIDAMMTVGRGQRMGIFSGSGVGKSVLMGMLARSSAADVTVIALIGERGREVRDFVEKDLGPEGLKRSVVVASTGDGPPPLRVQAGATATAIAEHFRDRGCDVLLLMDSLTRLAWAQRQIGLAAGEPPATKGYTPSVLDLLPRLLERCGRTASGSITGFYTVLLEGDDMSEPVADAIRAVTDGHILLSRDLGDLGHYPAVDILRSVSRVMGDVADAEHRAAAREIHKLAAMHSQVEDLVNIGAYQFGVNEGNDLAIQAMPKIREFLAQAIAERATFEKTRAGLLELVRQVGLMRKRPVGKPAQPAWIGRT